MPIRGYTVTYRDTITPSSTIAPPTPAPTATAAPHPLSAIASTIVNVAVGKARLPSSLTRFAPLVGALGCLAACVGYHYLETVHRRRRVQLAVFCIIRHLENDPNYATIARDPERLRQYAMDELNYLMEEELDWVEGKEAYTILKRRAEDDPENGLTSRHRAAKRSRNARIEITVESRESGTEEELQSGESTPGASPVSEPVTDQAEEAADTAIASSVAYTPTTITSDEWDGLFEDAPRRVTRAATAAREQRAKDPPSSGYRPVQGGYGFEYRSDEEDEDDERTSSKRSGTSAGYRPVSGNAYGFRYSDEVSTSPQRDEEVTNEDGTLEDEDTVVDAQTPPTQDGAEGRTSESPMLPVYRAPKKKEAKQEAPQEDEEEEDNSDAEEQEPVNRTSRRRLQPIVEEEEEEELVVVAQLAQPEPLNIPVELVDMDIHKSYTSLEEAIRPGGRLNPHSAESSSSRPISLGPMHSSHNGSKPASKSRGSDNRSSGNRISSNRTSKKSKTSSHRSTGNASHVAAAAHSVSSSTQSTRKRRVGRPPAKAAAAPSMPASTVERGERRRSSTRKTRYRGDFR